MNQQSTNTKQSSTVVPNNNVDGTVNCILYDNASEPNDNEGIEKENRERKEQTQRWAKIMYIIHTNSLVF